ncbi:MAG TPA: propionate catabolism operon regulatory protein PrpR [Thiobacillaceae bacterium]|nr:propionate catabolism operon regulatory protein PrpR [Thiobacillaceae bacterium]
MSPSKPKIWLLGFSLASFLPEVLAEYAARAEVRVINRLFDDAVSEARQLWQAGEANVFIAAGANGAFLREHLDAPVVRVSVSGFDILHALQQARRVSNRIALFGYQSVRAELEEVKALLNVEVEQGYYTAPEDAEVRVRELAGRGFRVVVGSSMVCRLAREMGMEAVFLYSPQGLRRALDDALDIARVTALEQARLAWLDAGLKALDQAVVAVDAEDRIRSLNPAGARLLGIAQEQALGRRLGDLNPALSLAGVLAGDADEGDRDRVVVLNGRAWLTNRVPIPEGDACAGAVLAAREAVAIERADRSLRTQARPRQFTARHRLEDILGGTPAMARALAAARQYAAVEATVLISGESGTGKELFAQGIHNAGRRATAPFVAINCAAVAESLLESELFGHEEGAFTGARKGGKAGLVEAAHTGTLFLDEIGDLPPALQAKLLRVLQEREVLRVGATEPTPVDVRVIAATHRDLRQALAEGRFRADLFFRLNILALSLPPLRDRPEDLPVLAEHFARAAVTRLGAADRHGELLDALLPRLTGYAWPGNIRELENLLERAAVFAAATPDGRLDDATLAAVMPELGDDSQARAAQGPLRNAGREAERDHIRRVLAECGGDRTEAARRLGISRTTLWRRLGGA